MITSPQADQGLSKPPRITDLVQPPGEAFHEPSYLVREEEVEELVLLDSIAIQI